MNGLVSHIEFLLHEHNCVVVPDLGGFVVNVVSAHREGISDFHAPMCELVFNRDLKHNDGLLAQSYMKTAALSFEAATRKIEQEVQELKKRLREQRYLDLGKLGVFTMHDDERFVYMPAVFVRPAFFGLPTASLRPLIQIPASILPAPRENRQSLRRIGARAAAVAAVGLLMFLLPGSDSTVKRQSAQMLYESTWFRSNVENNVENPAVVMPISEGSQDTPFVYETENALQETGNIAENLPVAEAIIENVPAYHIVVGVFEFAEGANKTMDLLAANVSFAQAAQIERAGRIYVIAASHSNRSAAEAYLRRLHREYPVYFDAWIWRG